MKLEDQAKSIRQKLSNLSQKQGVSYQYTATSFLLERLVTRIISNRNLTFKILSNSSGSKRTRTEEKVFVVSSK